MLNDNSLLSAAIGCCYNAALPARFRLNMLYISILRVPGLQSVANLDSAFSSLPGLVYTYMLCGEALGA